MDYVYTAMREVHRTRSRDIPPPPSPQAGALFQNCAEIQIRLKPNLSVNQALVTTVLVDEAEQADV